MDQRLKERVIGAIVVVGLGVIFIPMFLSGPKDPAARAGRVATPAGGDNTRVVTIDLREHTGSVPRPDAPPPSEQATAPALQSEQSSPDEASPAAGQETPPAEKRAPSTPVAQGPAQTDSARPGPAAQQEATGDWAVQVGSFSSRDNAGRLASQLKDQGFAAFVSRYQDGGRILHRVRVGPVATRPEAESLAQRLSQAGQKAKVVPNP